MSATPIPPTAQAELIKEATTGIDQLLNNDLEGAKTILAANQDSPYHLVAMGLCSFLAAALGQEDSELQSALATLQKAETMANAHAATKRGKHEPATVYPPGTEYKVLIADSVVCQALVHILTESYVEFMKAVYKLNRAYKGFGAVYKIVFPTPVTEKHTLAEIFTALNRSYTAGLRKAEASTSSESVVSSFLGGWGSSKKKTQHSHLDSIRPSTSSSTLPNLNRLSLSDDTTLSASAPNSYPASTSTSRSPSPTSATTTTPKHLHDEDGTPLPAPQWKGDVLSTLVISGAAFGTGLFGLLFSILSPRMRKLIGWFGFGSSNRHVSLKLLTVAASTGDDVHGYFATLSLLTFYSIILLLSGWQAEEQFLISQCEAVLAPILHKFDQGTLWILNSAKIRRMKRDTAGAIEVMEGALAKGSMFRQADSLIVFELAWTLLSDAQWQKAADNFLRMRTLNNWSYATYAGLALGCLVEIPASERTLEVEKQITDLYDELPSLFGLKRVMGEPPATEVLILRKVAAYKAKHARWVQSGRLDAGSHPTQVIRISPAFELGLFWNVTGRATPAALKIQIDRLSALTPPPRFGPSAPTSQPPAYTNATLQATETSYDLDTVDELALRDLLLGNLHRVAGDLTVARQFLQACIDAKPTVLEETWCPPVAMFEMVVLICHEAERECEKSKEVKDHKRIWTVKSKEAEKLLEALFPLPDYDLKSRLESRAQMLRDQIGERKAKLGI